MWDLESNEYTEDCHKMGIAYFRNSKNFRNIFVMYKIWNNMILFFYDVNDSKNLTLKDECEIESILKKTMNAR